MNARFRLDSVTGKTILQIDTENVAEARALKELDGATAVYGDLLGNMFGELFWIRLELPDAGTESIESTSGTSTKDH